MKIVKDIHTVGEFLKISESKNQAGQSLKEAPAWLALAGSWLQVLEPVAALEKLLFCRRAYVLQTHSADTGEFITLDLEILHITLVWQRPSEVVTSLGTELAEQAEGAFSLGRPWFGVGDFNQTPSQVLPDAGFQTFAVTDASGEFVPSRWDGQRCIDFGVCLGARVLPSIRYGDAKISDHKTVHVVLTELPTLRAGRVIQATPHFRKPDEVDAALWSNSLQLAWERVSEPPVGDTDEEWMQYCQAAEEAFVWASLHCVSGAPPEAEAVQRVLSGFRRGRWPKGSLPDVLHKQEQVKYRGSEGSFTSASSPIGWAGLKSTFFKAVGVVAARGYWPISSARGPRRFKALVLMPPS